jgi:DeoR/GlpR family transcriptional regulator of sugar metabolism
MIRPASTVIIDGGTTALALVRHLPPSLRATVVTHSPTIAAALIGFDGVDIQLIGGRIFKHSAVALGAEAAEQAARVRADLCFLGVTGVHAEEGLTTGDADEAAMKRLLSRRAAETWILGSAEKIGAASAFEVLPLTDIAGVLTDAPAEHETVRALGERGVQVVAV